MASTAYKAQGAGQKAEKEDIGRDGLHLEGVHRGNRSNVLE